MSRGTRPAPGLAPGAGRPPRPRPTRGRRTPASRAARRGRGRGRAGPGRWRRWRRPTGRARPSRPGGPGRGCVPHGAVVFQTRKSAPWPASTSSENSPASVVYQSKTPGRPGRKSVNKGMVNRPSLDRHTPDHVPEGGPEDHGEERGADREDGVPELAPQGIVRVGAEFDRDPPEDQQPEHDHEGHVEPAERGRVEPRECHEQDAARRDQPHLVPVPERADGGEDGPSLLVGPGDQAVHDARPEIEAVEDRVDGQHPGRWRTRPLPRSPPSSSTPGRGRSRLSRDEEEDAEHEIQAREAERREDHVPGVDRRG